MANEYLNRYQLFTANDQQNTIPYITIPAKNSDKKFIYKLGVSRLDKISQLYYNTPYFGWFILQSNSQYGGSELNIPDNAVLNIPFPLTSSLLDYKSALERYFYYYGEQ
jgi:hypothetical protein